MSSSQQFLFGAELGEENARAVQCRRCGCKIMKRGAGKLIRAENVKMHDHKGEKSSGERSSDYFFWKVEGLMAFDNIAVTHSIPVSLDGEKEEKATLLPRMPYRYLTCAACEAEPIGFQELAGVVDNGMGSPAYISAHRVCNDGFRETSPDAKKSLVEYRKDQEARLRSYLVKQMRSNASRKAAT